MANQDFLTPKGVPFFNGANYEVWKFRMEAYLIDLNLDIWCFVLNGVQNEFYSESINIILKGLLE